MEFYLLREIQQVFEGFKKINNNKASSWESEVEMASFWQKKPCSQDLCALPKMWSCVPGEIGSHWGILKKFLTRVDLFKNTYGYYMEEGLTGGQPERSLSQESVWEVVLCVLQSCEALGTNYPSICVWQDGGKKGKSEKVVFRIRI